MQSPLLPEGRKAADLRIYPLDMVLHAAEEVTGFGHGKGRKSAADKARLAAKTMRDKKLRKTLKQFAEEHRGFDPEPWARLDEHEPVLFKALLYILAGFTWRETTKQLPLSVYDRARQALAALEEDVPTEEICLHRGMSLLNEWIKTQRLELTVRLDQGTFTQSFAVCNPLFVHVIDPLLIFLNASSAEFDFGVRECDCCGAIQLTGIRSRSYCTSHCGQTLTRRKRAAASGG
ncbi:hypothetical protein [Parahaliea mediterranea]|uniref:hypothetical protein n=1 Tax=Parahaliea mediterranea TaxID=651086 RepID=UPI000E2E8EA0|nr:hypothetical protein [Parahaliea mediterranea]